MTIGSRVWMGVAASCVGVQVAGAVLLRQSFQLAALSDLIQCALLASGVAALVPHALKSQGRVRIFWGLMTMGLGFWLAYQMMWTYFEVVLRTDVPDLFSGDIILFLHLVPMIAAMVLRPHTEQDEYSARLGRLDFALLAIGWMYLWALLILPWQYAQADIAIYNQNFNTLYLAEKLALLVALTAAWSTTKNQWRTTYGHFLAASAMYASSSYVANWAIGRNAYYSGGLYDAPLTASMAWITYIGLSSSAHAPEKDSVRVSTIYGVWMARLGMMAVLSLPLFGGWAFYVTAVPGAVRSFRIVLTLGTAVAMGVMVFARQHLLDRELLQLLSASRQSVEDLRILQEQLTESEKLASMGKLVGGVAHELNNPITAMLGYSDLLRDTEMGPEQLALADRVGQHVRQTQSLVSSLVSFAKPSLNRRGPVDLNAITRTAVKLCQPQHRALKLDVRVDLAAELPPLVGDSNQLLQVCMHMMSTVLYDGGGQGRSTLIISTIANENRAVLRVSLGTNTCMDREALAGTQEYENQGLGVCRNIVNAHGGTLEQSITSDGTLTARLELPVASLAFRTPAPPPSLAEPTQSFV